MKTFIGTKIIAARPMSRYEYNMLRGWVLPANEDGDDEGFLVEYTDGGKPNVDGYAGYVSWTPKEQFRKAYRETTRMTFGLALEALKKGHKVAREGWNGKDMWLSLSCGQVRQVLAAAFWSPHNRYHAIQQGGVANVLPSITMKTANGDILMGWLASQTDMLTDDWVIV